MERWRHQTEAVNQVMSRIDRGSRSMVLAAPTGAGKTVIMSDLLEALLQRGLKASLYASRTMLIEQLHGVLTSHGHPCGVRAATMPELLNLAAPVQICSLQTEISRSFRSSKWSRHPAHVVLFDEAHMQKSSQAKKVIEYYRSRGAVIIGVTATPIGLSKIYDELIEVVDNKELRAIRAHMPAITYAPSEIDTRKVALNKMTNEFVYQSLKDTYRAKVIIGHIVPEYFRINPNQTPTLLFAPGVAESIDLARELTDRYLIPAAHIDGDSCWVDGKTFESNREKRQEIVQRLREGDIKIVCNRFVLREGIDIPELGHLILATPIGSLLSYIQCVGRLLRYHPSLEKEGWLTIQDHGGNWYRHGSANESRSWSELWEVSDYEATRQRREKFGKDEDFGGITCRSCGLVFDPRLTNKGSACPKCGSVNDRPRRKLIQTDGSLYQMFGNPFPKLKYKEGPDAMAKWRQVYYRAKNAKRRKMTFRQAAALYKWEEGAWPDPTWPLMPKNPADMSKQVRILHPDRLN